jgi:hypothetical protein
VFRVFRGEVAVLRSWLWLMLSSASPHPFGTGLVELGSVSRFPLRTLR